MNVPLLAIVSIITFRMLAQEASPQVVALWPDGPPGFESRRNEAERAESYWVRNIHQPSLTVFRPPPEKATGAAVVICPGGGHRELVFNAEGVEPGRYLASLGVTAFALKYRLGREEGTPYSVDKHARQDGQRAMRLVRSRAKEWNVDPDRIGMAGFSAGGEVLAMTTFGPTDGDSSASDPIDRASCRPDFLIIIYPGPLGFPETVATNSPPAFFLAAVDDAGPARLISTLVPEFRSARVPVEAHLLAKGGHAFNMGNRSRFAAVKGWPQRMADWLSDMELLKPAPTNATKTATTSTQSP
jgi:acetyl esterase/lipase